MIIINRKYNVRSEKSMNRYVTKDNHSNTRIGNNSNISIIETTNNEDLFINKNIPNTTPQPFILNQVTSQTKKNH